MRRSITAATAALCISLAGCLDDWLVTTPQDILTDDQVYGDPALILGMLADYYDLLPFLHQIVTNHGSFRDWGEAMGQDPNLGTTNNPNVGQQFSANWSNGTTSWGLMRHLHVTMAGVEGSEALQPADRAQILAELRFIRAMWYFVMARSYGGVPIITDQLIYTPGNEDLTAVQIPRATEADTWDFIISELDEIMDQLGNDGSQTRANRASALALKSRAALYAASVARYNNELEQPLTTPGGEAGIPAERAAGYFQQSLDASRALIEGAAGSYALVTGADPSAAFASIFTNKGNSEVIMAKDFNAVQGKKHDFTLRVAPRSFGGEVYLNWGNGTISPVLNVLENFDRLDGTSGSMVGRGVWDVGNTALANTTDGSNWTYFENIGDIFEGYDGRMMGTIMVPGGIWYGHGGSPDLLAGVYEWTGSSYTRRDPLEPGRIDPVLGKVVGLDGTFNALVYTSSTGFAMQKYLDGTDPNARRFSPGGSTWAIWFRLGEIYLNAAEAGFELGLEDEALGYLNTLRARAGFPPNSLTTVDRDVIRSERWAELVFESHRWFDLRRWRIAHLYWDGTEANENATLQVLFPYRIHRPGHPDHGRYVFNRFRSTNNANAMNFGMGSYYAGIPAGARAGNPLLVCNPLQGGC